MPSRTIAIGDIHGCASALSALLKAVSPQGEDTLVFLGDYVDRGPDSADVIEQVVSLVGHCHVVPLIGNHELMMLNAVNDSRQMQFWTQHGGAETLASYGGSLAHVPPHHRAFFQNCVRYHETENHMFVHANYDPGLDLDEQSDDLLFWQHMTSRFPEPHISGKTVVVGHTPQLDGLPVDHGHIKLLDTFCYGGQWLTAYDVDSQRLWQANNHAETREAILE